VQAYLREARVPLRLACNRPDGHPLLVSLWYAPQGGGLWCATQRDSRVAECLARDGRCAFEVAGDEPPYRGVRGKARARLVHHRGEETLRRLIDRYLGDANPRLAGWLLARAATETAIEIEPCSLMSWDYTSRMEAGS
jgi:nitroimidazol reductase NimA-like FMN-containing flavoprotein (pyridoxamine 5'-phosphate oxidase superfamily)